MSEFIVGTNRRLTRRRVILALGACVAATLIAAVVAPLFGVIFDGGGDWHYDLLGRAALDPASIDHQVLLVRLPRVLASLVIGAALAGAGCALQALLRNPLAEPFTLGISSGSSLAAVVAIRIGVESAFGGAGIGAAALLGSVGSLLLIWRLARIGTQLPPATLVLAGVTLSMFCSSASVLIQSTSDFSDVTHMLGWMIGGLDAVRLVSVGYATIPILAGCAALIAYGRELNALAAGPEAAASVGVNVERTNTVIFAIASLLVGAAIAVAGPIGFIGLIVPHALRALLGPDHRVLLPASMFGGAVLLTICDTLARTIIPLHHLPTGAVTAVLGGPLFVRILLNQKRRAAMWGRA